MKKNCVEMCTWKPVNSFGSLAHPRPAQENNTHSRIGPS